MFGACRDPKLILVSVGATVPLGGGAGETIRPDAQPARGVRACACVCVRACVRVCALAQLCSRWHCHGQRGVRV